MELDKLSKEELELMGYDDIALLILQKHGKKMKLIDIFTEVCKVLELPDNIIQDHLVEFFEQMSTNKKFVMLDNGFWDLQSRHKPNIVIEDENSIDDDDDEFYDKDYYDDESEDKSIDTNDIESDDDIEDDNLDGLMIVDEDSDEE